MSVKGRNNADGSFNWKDALADAGILAGMTFFTTLVGLGVTGLMSNPAASVLAAIISAGAEFFGVMIAKRGLKPKGG